MIICPRCQYQNQDGVPWCQYCGLPFTAYPPQQVPPSQQIVQYDNASGQYTSYQQQPYYPPNYQLTQINNYNPAMIYEDKPKINELINYYVSRGFRVVSQTDYNAQLIRPKQFRGCLGLFLFFLGIAPLIIYMIIYLASKDKQIYLSTLPNGDLKINDDDGKKTIVTSRDDPIPSYESNGNAFLVVVIVAFVSFGLFLLISALS